MKDIKVRWIIPQAVEHFDPNGLSLGWLNQYEHNDLRIQIRENKAEGYYMMFEDNQFDINKDGKIVGPIPRGLYGLFSDQLTELI